jgi:flagellar biogenesis protein FliO
MSARQEQFQVSSTRAGVLSLALIVSGIFLAAPVLELGAATNFPGVNSPLPHAGMSVLRVFGAMVVVMAVFLGGVWLFRNWQRLAIPAGRSPKLNVFEAKSLGPRQTLFVVGYEQQRMLVASTPAGITLVSHLPPADESEPPAPASPNFQQVIQHMLQRK